MTDDDGDGRVNMCDIPDVVACSSIDGDLFDVVVLSGANGELLLQLFAFDTDQAFGECSLAVADLQNDGTPDLITMSRSGVLRAITPDGAVLWQGSVPVFTPATDEYDPTQAIPAALFEQSQPAVHDLESDGLPEILIGLSVYNSDGTLRFRDPTQGTEFADGYVVGDPTPDWRLVAWAPILPTIADLDGDGTAEVLFGHVTYRSDGAEMWRLDPAIGPVIPHPADFDGDGETEILAVSRDGLLLLSSGGEVLWGPIRPPENGVPPRFDCWIHPAAIADMDNDGLPEAIVNSCEHRLVLDISDAGVQVLRAEPVPITTVFGAPWSGSVAFDFRGSGEDWLAYHHQGLTLFDGTGSTVMSQVYADSSGEGPTYPVVADVDNDGSADVVINDRSGVVVYEDVFQRPSPARRIWNQWNYVANSVREDGLVVSPVADGSIGQRVQRPLACVP